MKTANNYILLIVLTLIILGFGTVAAQQNIAQQAYAIFERNCLNCHGEHGAFTEEIVIDYTALIETGAVVPRKPGASELYQRLIEKRLERRMPLGQPPLTPAAVDTIRRWILADAPNWADTPESDSPFITPKEMLESIEKHVNSLAPFDRTYARYFTMTHLYNAGERAEALHAYQRALSKLVNSLSWGREVTIPQAIDPEETVFYIDLRDYEWEIGTNRWTQIEQMYPYSIEFNAPTQTNLHEKLTDLREAMNCEVPFVHVDWFLATASLPPLYHDILDLPATDRELEDRLEVNVVENLRNAAGKRVWRAGFNDSGVSNNNRVVERHVSRYGAYWKSYDFAGSVDTQYIFTNPLSFTHDGGEVVFNLPNGLQAYYLADAGGRRLDAAPIDIVSNPAASDPTVRNGLSCIGCHTEGMKTFEDQVRGVVEKNPNPPYDKARALSLYVDKATMDGFIDVDTNRYRQSLEAAGGIFGGIEPIQRFHEAFHAPLDIAHAAAVVGLTQQGFLSKIRQSASLKNLGLLVLATGTIKRDTWTSKYQDIVRALDFPNQQISVDRQTEIVPGAQVYIPDPNLRAVITEALGKVPGVAVTVEEMATLEGVVASGRGIRDLRGIEYAVNAWSIELAFNEISDLSPLAGLAKGRLNSLWLSFNRISDLSPLAELTELEQLNFTSNPEVTDLSPISGLTKLKGLWMSEMRGISSLSAIAKLVNLEEFFIWGSPISDISVLGNFTKLEMLDICGSKVSDFSVLSKLRNLKELYLAENDISDVSAFRHLTKLTRLSLTRNNISDVSPLASLRNLKWLALHQNDISDLSPLAALSKTTKIVWHENPGFPKGGEKIEGPWLWVTVPGKQLDESTDLLAQASGGTVTEKRIATQGATEGNAVGESLWQSHALAPQGGENIKQMLSGAGVEPTRHPDYLVYGSVRLISPRQQKTKMYAGSTDNHKVWLNGTLVDSDLKNIWAEDYANIFPVTLKRGVNVLLVAVDNSWGWNWGGYFGFEAGTDYTVLNPQVGYTFSEAALYLGEMFTLDITAENIHDLAGWQFNIVFDPTMLEAVQVSEGNFLKSGNATTFFKKGSIDNAAGKITQLSSARLSEDGVIGTGVLVSVGFRAKSAGQTLLKLENFQLASIHGASIAAGPHEVSVTLEGRLSTGDVNQDGQVSILDMVLVARHLGKTPPANSDIDINGDGIINILDLILVAQHMGDSTAPAAPLLVDSDGRDDLASAMIQAWIQRAKLEDDGSLAFREGIAKLQSLLASLIPEKTALLANYPNPFNPETWIPYHLAEASVVRVSIYDQWGRVVRHLDLGHRLTGRYESRSRAAYWDGRNSVGESVASGIYFYTFTVSGSYTTTRKMLILK